MNICFFGYPNQNYSRNSVLIKGLRANKAKISLCTDKTGLFLTRYIKLFKKFQKIASKVDVIFVMFPGHLNMPVAWVLGKIFKKPVVFDCFISLYDTYVFDRQAFPKDSLKAKFYWHLDKLSCQLADKALLDTQSHINFFVRTFKLPRHKFEYIPVGADDSDFKPIKKTKTKNQKIIIEFHGMFTKLHGAEHFVRAAKALEKHKNLEFWLIGSSTNYLFPLKLVEKLKPKNLKHWPRLTVKQLAKKTAQSHISVGHLGPTQKARMVITNKMYHALASRVALIAGNNLATREFLTNKKDCIYVKMNDQKDLVDKIKLLVQQPKLRQKIAQNGYKLHQSQFSNKILGKKLLQILKHTIDA